MIRSLIVALLLTLAMPAWAATLPQADPVPGGIALVALPPPATSATFEGHAVLVLPHAGQRFAVVGIPLATKPGQQFLTADLDGHAQRVPFTVGPKDYATQRLTIKNKAMVTLSKADLARVHHDSRIIDGVYATFTPKLYAKFPFALPVDGPETSPFGVHRILNGKPRAPHSGIDIAAAAGTPVLAPAAGVVAVVGNFFFDGNMVMINHGRGLISVYVHLSKMAVHVGEHVARGQRIGEVGATGRTTGADLHWTVTLNGTKINPELLLSPTELKAIK